MPYVLSDFERLIDAIEGANSMFDLPGRIDMPTMKAGLKDLSNQLTQIHSDIAALQIARVPGQVSQEPGQVPDAPASSNK